MADANMPPARRPVYEFMSNGGGLVTFRTVVPILGMACAALLGLMWNDLKTELAGMRSDLKSVTVLETTNAANIAGLQNGQQRIWSTLRDDGKDIADEGNRLTRLEACQPHCAPR